MHSYIHEKFAQARIDELIREAERHRLVKQARAKPRGRSNDWTASGFDRLSPRADWPSRLAMVIRNRRQRWQPGPASEQASAPAAGSELAPCAVGAEAAGSTEPR